jgi:hypothetical protein
MNGGAACSVKQSNVRLEYISNGDEIHIPEYMGNSIESQGDKYGGKGLISKKGKTWECSDRSQEEKMEEKERKKRGEGGGKG